MTFTEWKNSEDLKKRIKSAGVVIARDAEKKGDIEDVMVNGPYLDGIDLGLGPDETSEENEKEYDRRFDYLYDQVLKQAKKLWRPILP